jgi:hypothetical protein
MTHSVVGETDRTTTTEPIDSSLASGWYKNLTQEQLAAYVRFQFIYLHERIADWDAAAHTKRRPAWDGGKDSFGVKHSSAWAKAVRAITAANAHPGIWVYAHFRTAPRAMDMTTRVPEPRPAMLYSTGSADLYQNYCNTAPVTIRKQYDLAAETLKMRFASTAAYGLNKADQTLYVLGDESYVTATPFFRHAFAALSNCDRAIERYLWFAALEYEALQPLYDRAIKTEPELAWWTANDLPAAVCAIRQHWSNYDG